MVAATRSVPSTTADAKARRNSDLPQRCRGVTVLGYGAFINTGLVVPQRKRPGRPLLRGEEKDRAEHRKGRTRVENVISRIKNYKTRVAAGSTATASTTPRQPASTGCLTPVVCHTLYRPLSPVPPHGPRLLSQPSPTNRPVNPHQPVDPRHWRGPEKRVGRHPSARLRSCGPSE